MNIEKNISLNFDFGDMVFLRTDIYQYPRIVTAVMLRRGFIQYEVASGEQLSYHQMSELSATRDDELVKKYAEL